MGTFRRSYVLASWEENYFNGEIKGFCSKTDEFVETYSTEEEYKNLKSGHKNL